MDPEQRRWAAKWTDLGFASFEARRWEEAEHRFRAAAIANPDDEDAWIGLGSCLVQQLRNEEAAIVFGTAAAIARSSGAWPTLLAVEALIECGNFEKAHGAMAWFDALEQDEQTTEEQAAVARGLRVRLARVS